MKYSTETVIDLPRERVIELFDDPDNLPKWMDGLVSFRHISGEPGQPGAKSELVHQMGKRRIEMVETIVVRDLPERFDGTYEAKGVWNLVENRFFDEGDQTRWKVNTEFRCSGFLKVMAWLMPGAFRKQTAKHQADFKRFAEAQRR